MPTASSLAQDQAEIAKSSGGHRAVQIRGDDVFTLRNSLELQTHGSVQWQSQKEYPGVASHA